jgi:hypothetical protein
MSQGQRNDLRRDLTPTFCLDERGWCKACREGKHCYGECGCTVCSSLETKELLEASHALD